MLHLVLPLLLAACGTSAEDLRAEAQKSLDAGDAPKAMQLADEGLKAAAGDKAIAYRLEQVRLESLAKQGQGGNVAKELERLAGAYPQQVKAPLYRALADKSKSVGDTPGAIEVLAAGDKRFPEDPSFKEAIDELKNAGVSPEEVELLEKLGYL